MQQILNTHTVRFF